jgi:hypothetical protein
MKKIKKYPNGGTPQPAWNVPSNLFSAPTVPVFGMQNPNDTTSDQLKYIDMEGDPRVTAAMYKQWQSDVNSGQTPYTSFEEYKAAMNEEVPSLKIKGFHDVNIKPVAAPKTTTEYSTIKNYSYTPYAAPIAGLNAMVNFAGGLYNNQQAKQEEAQNNFLIQQPQASYFNKRMLKGDKAMYAAYGGELENKETSFLEFMNGGLVSPSMELGGPKPIYTSNRNDPRLKMYNDSLSLYNNGKKAFLEYNSDTYSQKDYLPSKTWGNTNVNRNEVKEALQGTISESAYGYLPAENYQDRIKLLKKSLATGIFPTNMIYPERYDPALIYKKPTQPIKYQKEPPVVRETPAPLNPNAPQQRTTGIPFLAPETPKQDTFLTEIKDTEYYNNGAPLAQPPFRVTPKTGVTSTNTTTPTTTSTPNAGATQQINYSYEGENKINMGGKYYTQAEFDKYFADNKTKLRIIPKANSVGKVYVPGKGIVDYKNYSASMLGYGKGGAVLKPKYEEGGEYEVDEKEYKRLLKLGYILE